MPAPSPQPRLPSRPAPGTPDGQARGDRLGLRAGHFVLLPHEDPAAFAALARAAHDAYAPADPLERELVEALAVALWRELRADRLEAEILADIAPADGARTCGSDLREPAHRASLATLIRYRAQTAQAVRRAQDALARHRRLVGRAERAALDPPRPQTSPEPGPRARPEAPAGDRRATPGAAAATRPEPGPGARPPDAAPPPTDPRPAPERTDALPRPPGPVRLRLREADRIARNPLDSDLLRALGRDPDLVLPVPGLIPEAWPLAQLKADPSGTPVNGQGPYRRVPHLPYGQWLAHQHLLAAMDAAATDPPATPPPHPEPRRAA